MIDLFLSVPVILFVMFSISIATHFEQHIVSLLLSLTSLIQLVVYFSLPWANVLLFAVIYLAIGVLFSVYRYRRFVSATTLKNGYLGDPFLREKMKNKLQSSNLSTAVTTWALTWPFCLMSFLVADVFTLFKMLFYILINRK